MRVFVDKTRLPALKSAAGKSLSGLLRTHTQEGLAASLGCSSYNSLKRRISKGGFVADLSPEHGLRRLESINPSYESDPLCFYRMVSELVIYERQELTCDGLGWDIGVACADESKYANPLRDVRSQYFDRQLVVAGDYAKLLLARKSVNRSFTTRDLKHRAEEHSEKSGERKYVSNAAMIVALIAGGFTAKKASWQVASAYTNVSSRLPH